MHNSTVSTVTVGVLSQPLSHCQSLAHTRSSSSLCSSNEQPRPKTGRQCSGTVGELGGFGRDGKSRGVQDQCIRFIRIVSLLSPDWPAGLHGERPRRFVLVVEWPEAGRACCVAAIRWTERRRALLAPPALSAILFFPTPSPTPTHSPSTRPNPWPTTPLYQALKGKSRAHHRAVRWRPDGSEKTSRRPRAAGPTTLTHVPLLSSVRTLLPSPLFLP